jgi:hypothetical protein
MMRATKIRLSPEEKALVLDPGWILTKRSVMDKVAALLGELADQYRAQTAGLEGLTPALKEGFPKLSRGENYRGLPYMILDYPAVFDRENVFAVRTLFWWGHYFSITIHLKGKYLYRHLPGLLDGLERGGGGEWHLAVSEDEWVHAVEQGHYTPYHALGGAQRTALAERPFFKMASTIPLDRWDDLYEQLGNRFGEILEWVG